MSQLKQFEQMWNAYPNPREGGGAAKSTIGGNADASWITNTCVLRVCRSFNYTNHDIPTDFAGLVTVSGGDGLRYAFRVSEFRRYLEEVYGPPTLSHQYSNSGGDVPESFKNRQGVICFVVTQWSDATGHMDLWNGNECVHSAYFNKASEVYLWEVDSDSDDVQLSLVNEPDSLSAAVGQGGENVAADVTKVQTLLIQQGIGPLSIDGLCGPRTIAAIFDFQARYLNRPDGRVDVDGRTWRELCRI